MKKNDDMDKYEISPRARKVLERGRAEARRSVIARGLLQFRVDPVTMEELLVLSESREVPLGRMLREWVKDRLRNEHKKAKQSDIADYRTLCLELRDELSKLRRAVSKKYS